MQDFTVSLPLTSKPGSREQHVSSQHKRPHSFIFPSPFFPILFHPTSFDNPVSTLAELLGLYWVVLSSRFNRQSPTAAV